VLLRQEERLSLNQITERTGVPKGTLSGWLRDNPLTNEELAQKRREGQLKTSRSRKRPQEEPSKLLKLAPIPLTKHQKAKLAETAALYRMIMVGLEVYGSPFDGDKADWVVGLRHKLYRIQVRAAQQQKQGRPVVSLRCSKGRKSTTRLQKNDFDFLVGYDVLSDTAYVWSFEELTHLRNFVSICETAKERWDKITGE
jgi:DNA-binding transcriptional ArsR family regulator